MSATPPEVLEVDHIAEWVLARAEKGPHINRYVFRGEPSEATDITRDFDELMANDADYYTVLEAPGGPYLPVIQVVFAFISVASMLMASKPDMPSNVNRAQESANNGLGPRENQVRVGQRMEDIYGTVNAIPCVLMQAYQKWVANRKVEYGYYGVTRGYADLERIRDGDTLINAIDGASAAVYWPFTSPNSGNAPVLQIGAPIIDPVLTVRRAVEVDGITLKAANQVQLEGYSGYVLLPPGAEYRSGNLNAPAAATDRIVQFWKRPNFNAVVTAGQTIELTPPDLVQSRTGMVSVLAAAHKFVDSSVASPSDPSVFDNLYVGATFTINGFVSPANNGTYAVVSKPDVATVVVASTSLIDEISTPDVTVEWHTMPAFAGTRTVQEVGDGWLILAGASFPFAYNDPLSGVGPNTNIVANNGLSDWTTWVTQPAADRNESWSNFGALQGMQKDNGGTFATSVTVEQQIQQLDASMNPIGGVITATATITGVTLEEIGETLEIATPWTGPARTRVRRITPYDYFFQGSVTDEVKWTDLSSVSPIGKPHFGNKTTIQTVTQATARATAVRQRQLNCLASRLLPKWIGGAFTGGFNADGSLAWGTIHRTSFIHEIIAAITLDRAIGNQPASRLDMPQMSSVVDQLYAMHPDAPTFNYTFDSADTSFKESISLVADAGFSMAYRQSGKIRLAHDHKQTTNTALFTHRNKKPKAQRIRRTFRNDSSFDGVEFTYQDPDTLQAETIRLPLDGSATRPKPFEKAGIRSFPQAWLRANREWAKIKGQRATLNDTCTTDARLLVPYARIEDVDNTRFKTSDGEVIAQQGLLLTLSQKVDFSTPGPHSIVLRKADGTLQGITVTTSSALQPNQVLLAELPAEAIKTTNDADGVRTIYSFGNDSRHGAQAWLVGEIGSPKDNYVSITAINYSDSYYAMDNQPIPARESVIN